MGDTSNLPSDEMLKPYNIYTLGIAQDGSLVPLIPPPDQPLIGKAVRVPLALTSDEKGGERVAFRRADPYMPWGNGHEMRMVWSVSMLIDMPCDLQDQEHVDLGCVPAERVSRGFSKTDRR